MSKKALDILNEMIEIAKKKEDPTGLKERVQKTIETLRASQQEVLQKTERMEKSLGESGSSKPLHAGVETTPMKKGLLIPSGSKKPLKAGVPSSQMKSERMEKSLGEGEQPSGSTKPVKQEVATTPMKKASAAPAPKPAMPKMGMPKPPPMPKMNTAAAPMAKGVDPKSHLPGVLIQKDEEKAMKKMELCKKLKKCWDMKKAQMNPDMKADAELGEKVEHEVENHMLQNKDAEMAEGHKIMQTAKKAEVLNKPYHSQAQRKWAHTENGKKALGGEAKVKEWDKESKGMKLPEKVEKK